MHESFLMLGEFERKAARDYLEDFMVKNKDSATILLPYHPV
jgi:hypothetical protein